MLLLKGAVYFPKAFPVHSHAFFSADTDVFTVKH